jgi:hypothetical protein
VFAGRDGNLLPVDVVVQAHARSPSFVTVMRHDFSKGIGQ